MIKKIINYFKNWNKIRKFKKKMKQMDDPDHFIYKQESLYVFTLISKGVHRFPQSGHPMANRAEGLAAVDQRNRKADYEKPPLTSRAFAL